jgi:hypothetical protein
MCRIPPHNKDSAFVISLNQLFVDILQIYFRQLSKNICYNLIPLGQRQFASIKPLEMQTNKAHS